METAEARVNNVQATTRGRGFWRRLRRLWMLCGLAATLAFVGWSLIAYRAGPEARDAAQGAPGVSVSYSNGVWRFEPSTPGSGRSVGLLFFPGSLVDPRAYAPLLLAAANAGYPAVLVELPRRGAFGGGRDPSVISKARQAIRTPGAPARWIVAGHSLGAVVTSSFAAEGDDRMAGLVLIGSSHPRDVDLSGLAVPVVKIAGTRDGLASPEKVEANLAKLPATARLIWIEGGNHSQFGWYGFQPGDRRARIPADSQRSIMIGAVLEALQEAGAPAN